jgi:hypothetical protein
MDFVLCFQTCGAHLMPIRWNPVSMLNLGEIVVLFCNSNTRARE